MLRCLTILNERGDTSICWTPDRDAEVERIVEKKMAEGITFFVITERCLRMKLEKASDAKKYRALAIPDEDWAMFVGDGGGEAVKTPEGKVGTVRKAKTAKEVASPEEGTHAVAVKPVRGG